MCKWLIKIDWYFGQQGKAFVGSSPSFQALEIKGLESDKRAMQN
jgi:hypothetical protein